MADLGGTVTEGGVTQRVAAILAADVAGYTRLMADDERSTIDALDAARAVFSEHVVANQGRIVDTAGDSVLAVFDIAAGAVQAATAIQSQLAEINAPLPEARAMHFRIGIHLGDIHEKTDGTIYGDGVNVAARLEGLAEPGSIIVSDIIFGAVKGRLDHTFADLGEHEVKNVTVPVRAYRVLLDGEFPETSRKKLKVSLAGTIAAGVAVVAVVAGVVWWQMRSSHDEREQFADTTEATQPDDIDPIMALPTGPSIAVLPFSNLSGDPEQEYFADGITEEIITALTRFRELFVISRNSTAQYKAQVPDVRDIGRDLGVQFVLQGSVRRSTEDIRFSVQLLDTETGGNLWAETYERTLSAENIFALQDELTNDVVAQLAGVYGVISREAAVRTGKSATHSLGAYECLLRTYEYWTLFTPEKHAEVRDCLELAVEEDPDYADAWAALGWIYGDEYRFGYNTKPDARDRSLEAGIRSVQLEPNSSMGQALLAQSYFTRNDVEAFYEHADLALSLNPNDALFLGALAEKIIFAGNFDRGVPLMEKARSLNPVHPKWYFYSLSYAAYQQRDYAQAVSLAEKADLPGFYWTWVYRAASYGQAGMLEEAQTAARELRSLHPEYVSNWAEEMRMWNFPDEMADHLGEGLEKARLFDEPEAPSRPVIAVLPFDNMSDNPEQEYFADGITEDITTRLAQYPNLRVMGRHTTFQYRNPGADVAAIGAELGAAYVVEGSVRRSGESVRVSAQLLESGSGTHLWADSFDRPLDPADIFAIQDEIADAIAARVGDPYGAIATTEFDRVERQAPRRLSSYDCALRYYAYLRMPSAHNHLKARDCLEAAIAVEPDYAEGHAYLGSLYANELALGQNPKPDSSFDRAVAAAKKGVALRPDSAIANVLLGRTLLFVGERERSLRAVDTALQLEPNNVDVYSIAGETYNRAGLFDRSMAIWKEATALNPNYPKWMNWWPARAHLAHGEWDDAIYWADRTGMTEWYWTNALRAAAYCLSGDLPNAKEAMNATLESSPDFAARFWKEAEFWNSGGETVSLLDNWRAGLNGCGLDIPERPTVVE